MTEETTQGDVNTINISLREYKSLLDDSEMLRALYAAGVQNWDGYDIAIEEMERNV